MLRYNNQLLFPTLKLISTCHPVDNPKNMLYSLDWTGTDSLKKEKWIKSRPCQPFYETFPGTLPEEYCKWVNEMQYAIPQGLLEEIRHCSLRAEEEWGRRKPETRWEPIPTRGPTAAYVFSAFTMVADCLYDPETNNYSRDDRKILIPYILAYRFWSFQTKPDNLTLYSGLNDLKANPTSNNFIDFIVNIELHTDLLRDKKEVAVHKIPKATFLDVLNNQCTSAIGDNVSPKIFLPDGKQLTLLGPKLSSDESYSIRVFGNKHICKGLFLTTEINAPINTENINIPFSSDHGHFFIKDNTCTLEITKYKIISMSGTPPPIITIQINEFNVKSSIDSRFIGRAQGDSKIVKCMNKKSFAERHPNVKIIEDYQGWQNGSSTSIKKIDVDRIKEVRDEDLEANADFKEIDMKPTYDADNSFCIRPKKHK